MLGARAASDTIAARRLDSRRQPRCIRASISASSPTARSSSSRTARRWAPASAPSLPLVAADELDADWKRVRDRAGASATRSTAIQNTDGSRSIRDFYDAFREAGATAALMLDRAAAAQVERAGARVHGAESRGRPREERQESSATARWSPLAAKLPVPQERRAEVQDARASSATSARNARSSTSRHRHRQGALRPRRQLPGHGVRRRSSTRRCSAARSKSCRRQGGASRCKGVQQTRDARRASSRRTSSSRSAASPSSPTTPGRRCRAARS